jgi:hypothetical protein
MTDNSLAPDSPNIGSQIEQNTKGDRNKIFGQMSGGTIISDVGQVNYYVSHDGKLQAHTESKPSPPKIPSLLPYLPNRKQQDEELFEAIQNYLNQVPPKPLVCVIHGDEFQSHDKFLERLKKLSFPKYMDWDSKQMSVKDYDLAWPSELKKLDDLESLLCKDLAEKFLSSSSINKDTIKETINKAFCEYPSPIIICTYLLTEDWQNQGDLILDKFLHFWQNWPDLTPGKRIIICLSIKYQVKKKGSSKDSIFIRFWAYLINYFKPQNYQSENKKIKTKLEKLSDESFRQFSRLSGIVLPELTGVSRSQVETWARSDVVKDFIGEEMVGKLIDNITEMFQNHPSKTIPMSDLAEELGNILKKLKTFNCD